MTGMRIGMASDGGEVARLVKGILRIIQEGCGGLASRL